MKKLCSILLICSVLLLSVAGCGNDKKTNSGTPDTGSIASEPESSVKVLVGTKIEISDNDAQNPIGINGEWFYYCSDKDNHNDTADSTFCKYDLNTGESTALGTIKNYTTSTVTYAFLGGNKIFHTIGVAGGEWGTNLHLMIDADNCNTTVLNESTCFPPLVDTYPVNGTHYLEYQPEKIDDDGGYLYHVRIGDTDGNTTEIITKERSGGTGTTYNGTTLVSVDSFDDIIYTFEAVDGEYNICSYDLTGKELSRETNDLVTELLETPDELSGTRYALSNMSVINGYYFFSTMGGKKLVLHRTSEGLVKADALNRPGLRLIWCRVPNDGSRIIMYDSDKELLAVFNTADESMTEYKLSGAGKSPWLNTDGNTIVYNNYNNELFFAKID